MVNPGQPPHTPTRSGSSTKPPPFTPRKRKDSTDSLHPEPPPNGDDSPLGLLAPGCSLLIRGLADTRATNPVTALEKYMDAARAKDPSLAEISVVIKMFKPHDATWSSSCYLHLHESYTPVGSQGPESEPRTDLLDQWKDALSSIAPNLEVVYSPTKTDIDKRLWLRLPDLKGRSREECSTKILPSITDELEAKGIPVLARFPSNGGPILVLAKPSDVDRFARAGHITLKDPIGRQAVTKVKQLEICYAYEVGIVGFPDYMEGLEKQVVDWIKQQLPTKVAEHGRDLGDDTILAISMVDWESTRQLLALSESFLTKFAMYDNTMEPPRLLFHVNEAGIFRKKTVRTIVGDGVEVIQKLANEVEMIKRNMVTQDEFTGFRREYTMDRKLLQSQFEAQSETNRGFVSAIAEITDRQSRSDQALLCNMQTVTLSNHLADLKSSRNQARLMLFAETDPVKKEQMTRFIQEMDDEEKRLADSFALSVSNANTLLTKPAGLSLPPPPNQVNSSSHQTPSASTAVSSQPTNDQALQDQAIPPGLSLLPQRRGSAQLGSRGEKEKRRRTAANSMQVDGLVEDEDIVSTPCSPSPNPLMAASTEVVTPMTMSCPSRPNSTSSTVAAHRRGKRCVFVGVLDFLRDSTTVRRGRRLLFSCRSPPNYDFMRAAIMVYMIMVIVSSVMPAVNAAQYPTAASTEFTVYGLNARGLLGHGKIHDATKVIRNRKPTVFVISETMSQAKLSNQFLLDGDYHVLEQPAVPCQGRATSKWGLLVGVRSCVQIQRRIVDIHPALQNRVIVVDVVFTTVDLRCMVHRIIAAYAPWNPGGGELEKQFWPELAKLCLATPHSWTIIGDLNATVSPRERLSGGRESRDAFTKFLADTGATDLWSRVDDRSLHRDWTCRGENGGGTIVDRVVTSSATFTDGDIGVADRYSDYFRSDHRAIVGSIFHSLPDESPQAQNAARVNVSHLAHSALTTGPRRVRVPLKADKHKFKEFSDRVDEEILKLGIADEPVTDDRAFIRRYEQLTTIFTGVAVQTFGRHKPYKPKPHRKVVNAKIEQLSKQRNEIGAVIHAVKTSSTQTASPRVAKLEQSLANQYRRVVDLFPSFSVFLQHRRKLLNKEVNLERRRELVSRAKTAETRRIADVLKGASSKRLFFNPFVPFPRIVNDLEDPSKLIAEPEAVKSTTKEYFRRLYEKADVADMPKPWLTTPSVVEVRDRVESDPFVWPQRAALDDFRAMLRRGNPRPAPGPDGWEKWVVKALSDSALQLVLGLHNYEVENARFPGDVKDMFLTAFHKKGLQTDLSNWRGLFLSNFLANSPMTWLNNCLIKYAAKKTILPDTQVAAQPGVQTRDLMSFLASVKCWAKRHGKTVYAIKRDQMKGFDRLHPSGFYDAVQAYGLPQAIIDLDKAAQTNSRCFIRTAYGLTDALVISDVAKQGGPLSPLKSTFTTSMGHRYLDDLVKGHPDALVMATKSNLAGDPHLPDDRLTTTVTMVEATDDSYLLGLGVLGLREFTQEMERFQFSYGWVTNWTKTTAFVLNPGPSTIPDKLSFPSVSTDPGTDPMTVVEHEVPLVVDDMDFLGTAVDNPTQRYQELKEIITNFQFPYTLGRPQLTLIRKIVTQKIVSRCRALLTLQPLKPQDAEALDSALIQRVHKLLGFPYSPSPDIATLPISFHGFGFPSLTRINAGIAVNGLLRDLNHHISAYRIVARITLAEWTCDRNGCVDPLSATGMKRDFIHHYKSIPSGWLIAHKVMRTMNPVLLVPRTDQSNILSGDVSLSHLVNVFNHLHPQQMVKRMLTGPGMRSLRSKGIRRIADVGLWQHGTDGTISVKQRELEFDNSWSEAARENWKKLGEVLMKIDLRCITNGPIELAVPSAERRSQAEQYIAVAAQSSKFTPSTIAGPQQWATDGSMTPASASVLEQKSVIGAATGAQTSLAMKLEGGNVSILHGELAGLILALVLDQPSTSGDSSIVWTDHLNSVCLIEDHRSQILQDTRLRHNNGRSLYRWLLLLLDEKHASTGIVYTPGHSSEKSLPALMNANADHFASKSQDLKHNLLRFPTAHFTMDEFTLYRQGYGWIESSVLSFIDAVLTAETATNLSQKSRMATFIYDSTPPPEYSYVRATSAYSAAVQLYLRSGQLPTVDVDHARGARDDDRCIFGCGVKGDVHHLFVNCSRYTRWRTDVGLELSRKTALLVEGKGLLADAKTAIVEMAKHLLDDCNEMWPLTYTQFYLGLIPPLKVWINSSNMPGHGAIASQKLRSTISHEWHTQSIRLAGRIYGDYQREKALISGCEKRVIFPSDR